MVKTRNLRRNQKRNQAPRRDEAEEIPPPPEEIPPPPEEIPQSRTPEPSPQSRQTPEGARDETRSQFAEAMQPNGFYFDEKDYMEYSKFQTRCDQFGVVRYLKTLLMNDEDGLRWFTEHPQFKHLFHMEGVQNRKVMGMWMLLLRTAITDRKNQIWFVVNGVPIRYSIREHARLSGLYCDHYPNDYKEAGSMDFVKRYFKTENVEVKDVRDKLGEMGPGNDRLKMAVLYFLSTVIYGRSKMVGGKIEKFILRVVDNLEFCKIFPWGRFTFDDTVKMVWHLMDHFGGEVAASWTLAGFILPLELLAFECIPALKTAYRVPVPNADTSCPKMCKETYRETSYKGYRLKEIYNKLGETKDIHSIVPAEDSEERLMMRCLGELFFDVDLRQEVVGIDPFVDQWNQILVNLRKKIFWENLYNRDCQSRVPQAATEAARVPRADRVPKAARVPRADRVPNTAQVPNAAPVPQAAPETGSMPEDQTNEQLRTQLQNVMSELAQVKEELVVIKKKQKTMDDFMDEHRRERRNTWENQDFQWSPQRAWFETGGTSAQGEMGGTSAQQTAPEMGGTPAQQTSPEMGGTPAQQTAAEMGGTPAPLLLTGRRQRFKQCARKRVVIPSKAKRSPYTEGKGKKPAAKEKGKGKGKK